MNTTDSFPYTILDSEHNVVGTRDLKTWGRWYENFENRRVAFDEIGDTRISTVFLGIDHSYGSGPPLWFETMVFAPADKPFDQFTERYTTWAEAEAGHALIVAAIREGRDPESAVPQR